MSKQKLLANALEKTGIGSLLSSTIGRWDGLLVFNYHRIGDPLGSPFDHALWSATQEEFENQIRFLKKNFDIIKVDDLGDLRETSRQKSVMITFDDGYLDNYELAFPVLSQQNTSALFFMTTGFLDQRQIAWWDEIAWMVRTSDKECLPGFEWSRSPLLISSADSISKTIRHLLNIYKGLPSEMACEFLDSVARVCGTGRCPPHIADSQWMTWDMVREMDQKGMEFGGHTVTHPVLANTDAETQKFEIVESKRRIETEIGHPIKAFSYPVGQPESFNAETKSILQQAGYDWAFSFFGGFCSSNLNDRFDIPRVGVSPYVSSALFRSTARLPWVFA